MRNISTILSKLETDPSTMTEVELLACVLSKNPGAAEIKAAGKLLSKEPGIKYSPRLKAAESLGKRLTNKAKLVFLKPRDIWEELRDIRISKKEHFVVFFLDTRNGEIERNVVSIGTLNYNLVHPREVFYPAIQHLAAEVILAHNHPSGCLEPSDEDLSLTKRLVQGGKLLGIEVLDHVIVTKDAFSSFKQRNLL